jgi:hypothetical protein
MGNATSDLVAAFCVNFSTEVFRASQDLRCRIDKISDVATSVGHVDGTELDAANRRLRELDEVAGDYTQVFPMLRDSNSGALDLWAITPVSRSRLRVLMHSLAA